jgi:hypothetical protein
MQNLPSSVTSKLLCSSKRELQKVSGIPYEALTEELQITRLNVLIGRLLDQSDVTTACRLEAMFNHHNQVMCCARIVFDIVLCLRCT